VGGRESATRFRIAVMHDGFVPVYRQRFFERLNEVSDHEYVIFHGQPIRGSGHRENRGPFAFPNVHSKNLQIGLGRRVLVYEPVVRHVISGGYDAIVVGHQFKFVAAMLLFAWFQLAGKPALLWGHGYHRRRDTLAARWLSHRVARIADGYLAYTRSGAEHLERCGLAPERIAVLRNTIDMDEQEAAFEAAQALDPKALKVELGFEPSTPVLLFVGRLSPHKRVEELLSVVARLDADPALGPVGLAVVGDGPLRPAVEAQAAAMPNVRLLGPVYDAVAVARLMRLCEATVIPGSIGLAANHSFAQGLPVITRAHPDHSPEIEYVGCGRNGLIVEGDLDAFVAAIGTYLRDPDLRSQLRDGARTTARGLDLGHSARQFDQGVVETIQRLRNRDGGRGAT
jgi:glycosyltransferase involved in cell wall biosynthesis